MKINRYKKANKTLNFYKNNFGFRTPFQVLIDATFCFTALKNQIKISEQIPRYLQAETILITTQCIIVEAEKLGTQIQAATTIVKQFLVHKCGHEKKTISAIGCIKSMIKSNRYIVAANDRELQDYLRTRPGQPIMYLHNKTPVLEQPSEISRKAVEFKMNDIITFGENDKNKLTSLKKTEGIAIDENDKKLKKIKKKKQPNPLSCKKKKKKPNTMEQFNKQKEGIKDKTIEKKKRKRIKLPAHVKDVLLNTN